MQDGHKLGMLTQDDFCVMEGTTQYTHPKVTSCGHMRWTRGGNGHARYVPPSEILHSLIFYSFNTDAAKRLTVGSSYVYETMIRSGADVNEPDEDGNTHLISTARGGHIKCIKVLLKAGADVNKNGKDGDHCFDRGCRKWI